MQKFGEMCITTYKNNSHGDKLVNRGTPSIWVGQDENHPAGTYRIFNPNTKNIILTWDMSFLHKSYSEYTKVDKPVVVTASYEALDDKEEHETVPVLNNNNNINIVSNSDTDSSEEDFKNDDNNFLMKTSMTK